MPEYKLVGQGAESQVKETADGESLPKGVAIEYRKAKKSPPIPFPFKKNPGHLPRLPL